MILSNNNSNIKELRNKKNKHDLNSYMDFMVKNKMKSNSFFSKSKQYIKIFIPFIISVFIILFSMFIATFIDSLLNMYMNDAGGISTKIDYEGFRLIYTISTYTLMFVMCLICIKSSFYNYKKDLFMKNKLVVNWNFAFCFILISVILQLISGIQMHFVNVSDIDYGSLGIKTIISTIIATFVAPIIEELTFRYIIYGYAYKASNNKLCANIIQAVLFGIIHFNFILFPIYAFGGYLLGAVRDKYGIKLSSLYHIPINCVALIPFTFFITNIYLQVCILIVCIMSLIYFVIKCFENINIEIKEQ